MTLALQNNASRLAVVGWLVLAATALFQSAETAVPWEMSYAVSTVLSVLTAAFTLAALMRILPVADRGRTARRAIIALGGLAIVALALFNWAIILWAALLSLAAVVAARSATLAGASTRATTWVLAASWPAAFAVYVVLDRVEFGRMDEYGDYPWAGGIGVAVWAVIYAVGLSMLNNVTRAADLPPVQPAPPPVE